jgi:hypothetical protein
MGRKYFIRIRICLSVILKYGSKSSRIHLITDPKGYTDPNSVIQHFWIRTLKLNQLRNPVLRIRDVYPGSEFFHPGSRVEKIPFPDPHQRI